MLGLQEPFDKSHSVQVTCQYTCEHTHSDTHIYTHWHRIQEHTCDCAARMIKYRFEFNKKSTCFPEAFKSLDVVYIV